MSEAVVSRTLRFSIRELLIAFAAVTCILGAHSQFGFLGSASVALTIGIVLAAYGRRTKAIWIGVGGLTLSIFAFWLLAIRIAGWFLFDVGPIYNAANYPSEFNEMVRVAGCDISDAKVEGLGSFIDSEHVWRITLAPDQVNRVIAHYGLSEVPEENVPAAFWESFPGWWRPSAGANSRYLSTPAFPLHNRGPDGDHCFALHDVASQRLYVWYKFNF
jgi:hypothetical protein